MLEMTKDEGSTEQSALNALRYRAMRLAMSAPQDVQDWLREKMDPTFPDQDITPELVDAVADATIALITFK